MSHVRNTGSGQPPGGGPGPDPEPRGRSPAPAAGRAGAVCTAAVALPLIGAIGAQAATTATPAYTTLKLVNGWASYGSGLAKPAVANINGIVHLKGGMKTSGSNNVAFT